MATSEQKPAETLLSDGDFARLEELLQSESEPAEILKAAAAEYARQVSQGTLQSKYDSDAVLEMPAADPLDKGLGDSNWG